MMNTLAPKGNPHGSTVQGHAAAPLPVCFTQTFYTYIYLLPRLRSEPPNTATTKRRGAQVSGSGNMGLKQTFSTLPPPPARPQSSGSRLGKKLILVTQSVISCVPRKTTIIDSSLATRKASVSWMASRMDLFDTLLSALSKEEHAHCIGKRTER